MVEVSQDAAAFISTRESLANKLLFYQLCNKEALRKNAICGNISETPNKANIGFRSNINSLTQYDDYSE